MERVKQCKNCTQEFQITDKDLGFYKQMKVPEPTFCPDCRQQRRLIWRNERTLYKRKCDATGKDIVSVFSQEKPFVVYDNPYWHSDKWDALDYGRDFDFSRTFLEQFEELMQEVPQLARSAVNNQNCDFVNQCGWCKNCYLIFEADGNENCFYSNNIYDSKVTLDILHGTACTLCYECVNCQNCYNLKYSQHCQNCNDSWFLKNCIGCNNCFGCVNMRNKQHYFLNEKYSKEEYEKKVEQLNLKTYKKIQESRDSFLEFVKKFPHKGTSGTQNEDSTGDYLWRTQRCEYCFDIEESQDCKFAYDTRKIKKVYDITVFGGQKGTEYCYENHEIGEGTRNVCFSDQVWIGCHDIFYSKLCVNGSHDLFGCVGLKHKKYCIFNKQYSEDEYEKLREKIIEHMKETPLASGQTGEWGEFFPASMSPFAYNETSAQYYFPLTKEQALAKGYRWKDPDPKEYKPQTYQTPELIENVPDTISNEILACIECKKNFKITEEEFRFYKKQKLPIPPKCPDCRHKYRFNLRNPRKLYARTCGKCDTDIQTTYEPNRPEPVYCEKCYLESII